MDQITLLEAMEGFADTIRSFLDETRKDLLALQNLKPRHSSESFYDRTREFQKDCEQFFYQTTLDEAYGLVSDTLL
ncbi:MAG: hypothetical protein ACYCX4_00045 [Bacillota bacterium]